MIDWSERLVSIVSFLCIVLFSFLLGSIFKGQSKTSHLSSCLSMLVAMTKSTLVGILVATYFSNIVYATIIAILTSFLFVTIMTYQLSTKVVIESFSALFMGAMMGVMLKLMTSTGELMSLLFFSIVYIASVLVAAGFWRQEQYVGFIKRVPRKLIISSLLIITLLGASALFETLPTLTSDFDVKTDHQHKPHH